MSEKKLKLKDGEIVVGQATRYFNLEILSNSSKSLNEGMEEEVVGDSTARFVFSS